MKPGGIPASAPQAAQPGRRRVWRRPLAKAPASYAMGVQAKAAAPSSARRLMGDTMGHPPFPCSLANFTALAKVYGKMRGGQACEGKGEVSDLVRSALLRDWLLLKVS